MAATKKPVAKAAVKKLSTGTTKKIIALAACCKAGTPSAPR